MKTMTTVKTGLLLAGLLFHTLTGTLGAQEKMKSVWIVQAHDDEVLAVAFSHNGKYALSASADRSLKLWTIETGKMVRIFRGHQDRVTTLAISPDDQYVLSGSRDKTLKLWELSTGKEIRTFKGHQGRVNSVVMTPDGLYGISGGRDSIPRYSSHRHREIINNIKLWEISTGTLLRSFSGYVYEVTAVAVAPKGTFIVGIGSDNTMAMWNILTGSLERNFQTTTYIQLSVKSLAITPDEKYVITGGAGDNSRIIIWDTETGKSLREFSGHRRDVNAVAVSPDGKHVISGGEDCTLKLWEIETGQCIRTFKGHDNRVTSVAISPDGKYILSGSADSTIKLWDMNSGKIIRPFGERKLIQVLDIGDLEVKESSSLDSTDIDESGGSN